MTNDELIAQMRTMASAITATILDSGNPVEMQADMLRKLRGRAYTQMMAFPDPSLGVRFHQNVYMEYAMVLIRLSSEWGLDYDAAEAESLRCTGTSGR